LIGEVVHFPSKDTEFSQVSQTKKDKENCTSALSGKFDIISVTIIWFCSDNLRVNLRKQQN